MATTPGQGALDAPGSRPISSNGALRSRPSAQLGALGGFGGLGVHTPLGSPVVEKTEVSVGHRSLLTRRCMDLQVHYK